MSPTLLVVGATGNTGGGVVQTLVDELPSHSSFSGYRIVALTRSASGAKAKELAALKNVEVVEKDWTMIDAAWLREYQVVRLFIASHNLPTHFTDESLFLTAALEAGVKYAVRISTTKSNVGPTTAVFYGRNHWAIENLLDQPEFGALQWTSLQPNGFTSLPLPTAVNWVQTYKSKGEKTNFSTILDEHAGVALVDSNEVGIIAGKLLISDDVDRHNKQKYVIVGPSNISGRQIIDLVEKYAGTKVDDVTFRDTAWIKYAESSYGPSVLASLSLAPRSGFNGACSIQESPTSPEVMELYAPKNGALEALEEALKKA